MITGVIKNKIDKIWTDIWAGGITNPLTVIEQLTYLMFIRSLDEKELENEEFENMTGEQMPKIFPQSAAGQSMRWSKFKNNDPRQIYDVIAQRVFPAIKNLKYGRLPDFTEQGEMLLIEDEAGRTDDGNTAFARYMSDAMFLIPTPQVLQKIITGLEDLYEHDIAELDMQGDLYEHMLGKLATAGQNGQFRTPKHIREMMVELLQPTPDDTICDPACGTAGFLVSASEYCGYPTGYLIIWQNPDVKLKDGGSAVGKKVLIDGQQRVTALMTAIAGYKILTENYEEKTIRIAFNPLAKDDEERFAVTTPAHENSSIWISDISKLFKADFDSYEFVDEYAEKNPSVSRKQVNQAITQLLAIKSCQLGAIILVPQLDISEVTEIFVRINSQGKRLNEADFAMSKIAADERYGGNSLRKAIDYFCHLAVDPAFYGQLSNGDKEFMATEYAPKLRWLKDDREDIYDPDYNDMLRVSFMHMFGRAKLGDLVSLLSGRDFIDRSFKEEIAEDSFRKLSTGVVNFMNQYNFEQFVLAIKAAGFISSKLLNSQMTLDFAYTLYLILQQTGEVPKIEIKRCIQKWFVLSTLTSRYIGSPESQMDRDLRTIAAKGFKEFLADNESAMLSDAFWDVRLVQNLETSSINSPYFNTFLAAQIFAGDRSLLSNSSKVSDLISVAGDVHHIFPREYLKKNGFNDRWQYNQVANYAYLDTGVNISIGMKAPNDYFSAAYQQCETGEIEVGTIIDRAMLIANLEANCIPSNIENMTAADYPEFLRQRRIMMAKKIKEYYYSL